MRIGDTYLDFGDVLIRPRRTTLKSRSEVNLVREFKFKHSPKIMSLVPIMASNMDTTGTFEVYKVLSEHKLLTCLSKFLTLDDYKEFMKDNIMDPNLFVVTVGIRESEFEKMCKIVEYTKCNWICVDVANGHMQCLVDYCRKIRDRFPDKVLIAGNVAIPEMTEELIINGKVDVVKCGIGGGSVCLTRKKTGVGVPQMATIDECSDVAHKNSAHIISDGGITCPGDASKAFVAGADFIMMGGQFAGHDENPGELIEDDDGKKYKMFYGMSSKHAMEKHYGKMEKYRSSEGRNIKIPYKGSLHNTVEDYLGGIRSCCTYIDAKKIKHMPKCGKVHPVSSQINNHFGK